MSQPLIAHIHHLILKYLRRYCIHPVFGSLSSVTLTFDLLTPKANQHIYEPKSVTKINQNSPHWTNNLWQTTIFMLTSYQFPQTWNEPQKYQSKLGATRCQVLRLKYTKFDFQWGSATDPAGKLTYSASQTTLAVYKGLLTKGREEKGE